MHHKAKISKRLASYRRKTFGYFIISLDVFDEYSNRSSCQPLLSYPGFPARHRSHMEYPFRPRFSCAERSETWLSLWIALKNQSLEPSSTYWNAIILLLHQIAEQRDTRLASF